MRLRVSESSAGQEILKGVLGAVKGSVASNGSDVEKIGELSLDGRLDEVYL